MPETPVRLTPEEEHEREFREAEAILLKTMRDEEGEWSEKALPPIPEDAWTNEPLVSTEVEGLPAGVARGIAELRRCLQVSENQWHVILTALVAAVMQTACSKPILFLTGKYNSGKTVRAMMMVAATRKELPPTQLTQLVYVFPSTIEDHFLIAEHFPAAAYDDLDPTANSKLYKHICMTSTGAGLVKRKLYANTEIITAGKTILVIYSGLSLPPLPEDLLSRHIIIKVEAPADENILDEDILFDRFRALHPLIYESVMFMANIVDATLKEAQRFPIRHGLRFRTFLRVGECLRNIFKWPREFSDDYEQFSGLSILSPVSKVDNVLLGLVQGSAGGKYETNTTDLLEILLKVDSSFEDAFDSPSSLGRFLSANSKEFKTVIVKQKKIKGKALWEFSMAPAPKRKTLELEDEEENQEEKEV